jgi:hydroxymethylglutaryl-CoA reductase (NADPH)
VVAEALLSEARVRADLRTTSDDLIRVNVDANLVGSAVPGAAGGCNAHAANVVAAVYLATRQDIAQVVSGSMCSTSISRYRDASTQGCRVTGTLDCGVVGGRDAPGVASSRHRVYGRDDECGVRGDDRGLNISRRVQSASVS